MHIWEFAVCYGRVAGGPVRRCAALGGWAGGECEGGVDVRTDLPCKLKAAKPPKVCGCFCLGNWRNLRKKWRNNWNIWKLKKKEKNEINWKLKRNKKNEEKWRKLNKLRKRKEKNWIN